MNTQSCHQKHLAGSASAFSLIELLTAMAVLAMVLALLLQVTDGILRSTRLQSQQMDSAGAARRALDMLALDLSSAVVGEGAAILASANPVNNVALLTHRRGTNAVDHRFLAVTYGLNAEKNQFLRTYRSVSYSEIDLLASAISSNNCTTNIAVDGILGLSVMVLTPSGSQSVGNASTSNYATNVYNGISVPTGWKALVSSSSSFATTLSNRAQGLDIWIAAVDDQNTKLLEDTGKLELVKNSLGSDPTLWRSKIDQLEIPIAARSSIQVLNKTIPIP